jgi:hypothetical protein
VPLLPVDVPLAPFEAARLATRQLAAAHAAPYASLLTPLARVDSLRGRVLRAGLCGRERDERRDHKDRRRNL